MTTLGHDPELSYGFVNLFSHGITPAEVFGNKTRAPHSENVSGNGASARHGNPAGLQARAEVD
jgi:hypothetical protein